MAASSHHSSKQSVFTRPVWVGVLAFVAAFGWGLAYPLIKMGFAAFGIMPSMISSKMTFAGIRFLISGLIILAVARSQGLDFGLRRRSDWWFVLLYAMVNTSLHYFCFYMGLSLSAGTRAAIVNSMGVFAVVLLAPLFFKSDHFTSRKVMGCAIGIMGIIALNWGNADSGLVNHLGELFIAANALSAAVASLLTRGLGKRVDVIVGTGYSLALGGLILLIYSVPTGGVLPQVTLGGIGILMMLICISTVSFVLYNKLVTLNPVGRVTIYNSLVPIVGVGSSCLCLGEPFFFKYFVAGVLATIGIYVVNSK